jgi:putative FmdB family regulatory protein
MPLDSKQIITNAGGCTLPTYEYACAACGNRYEKREGFDAKPRQKCPKCGKMAQRLLSTPAVVFKGSGFYKTDSRGSSSGESSSGESSSGASSSDKETSTPSATPAASSDGHGHSHGPGGHSHDAPATAAKSSDTAATPAKTTTTEKPAAK